MKTTHKDDCKAAFGRKDATCPRCQEMIAGAPARQGWGHSDKLSANPSNLQYSFSKSAYRTYEQRKSDAAVYAVAESAGVSKTFRAALLEVK